MPADADRVWHVEQVCRRLTDHYIFPDVAERLVKLLRARLARGAYRGLGDEAFAAAVTADLQSENGDKHLRLRHHVDPVPDAAEGEADPITERARAELDGHGIAGVTRLAGNVGYLDTTRLYPADMSGEAFASAMTLLASADVLLIDVRRNEGGSPGTVALLCTYLLDERTHLCDTCFRDGGRTEQLWTLPHVAGRRFGGTKPVYVLIGPDTFSGAEDLSYTLQQLARATIVGAPTKGGAHPRGQYKVDTHLDVTVSCARTINPISGTNWEGTGVLPDVPVPPGEAFERAYALALRHVLTLDAAGPRRPVAEQARGALAALGRAVP